MPRALTSNEQAVLAHCVIDPAAWWENACAAGNIADPEVALAQKVIRWQGEYDAALALDGENYQDRATREAEEV